MRVKQAGGRINDARGAAVGLDLEDVVGSGVGDDGDELEDDVLRHHVEGELEGKLLLLARRDLDVVLDGGQVAQDGGVGGRIIRQRLGGLERTADEGDADRRLLVVGNLEQSLGDMTVDDLDAEDVGIREDRLNVRLQLGVFDRHRGDGLIFELSSCASAIELPQSRRTKEKGQWQ